MFADFATYTDLINAGLLVAAMFSTPIAAKGTVWMGRNLLRLVSGFFGG